MKIFVAIPVYDGKLQIETVRCLMTEQMFARELGDELLVSLLPNCSHAAMGRNQLAQDFMESDCDRMVFLDADVTFEPGALVKIAHAPPAFVGGAYRYKQAAESYPVGWLGTGELWSDADGFIEVETLPGGFLSLSRRVFEVLKIRHPERAFEYFGKHMHCYFQMLFKDGHLCGEDSFFCQEWREAGEHVYLDPEITLTHWGSMPVAHVGHIGSWLKARAPEQKAV